jgi:hypothetical protein
MQAAALLDLIRRAFALPLPRLTMRRPDAKIVLVCLAAHADPDGGNAYPSRDRLAACCELSPRTIDKVLFQLQRLDLIAEQAPPTASRPRTWQLQLTRLGSQIEGTPATGSQIEQTRSTQLSLLSADFATDQVQEQVLEERAPAPVGAGVALTELRAQADGNYRVILRLAHLMLDVVGTRAALGELVEAVKEQCAKKRIVYWPGDVVHRAVAAALVQRIGRPVDPVALRALRDQSRRRSR